jgi:hypothetical protein
MLHKVEFPSRSLKLVTRLTAFISILQRNLGLVRRTARWEAMQDDKPEEKACNGKGVNSINVNSIKTCAKNAVGE